ncbi:hypothetical protein ACHHYP_10068 [Achlya hypogyna]|uniref:Uncharacterized protein n=1 Tax=Achlya hypogyna TaxID=1202772 RepID=A0A1V9ZIA2_ACHHY|nr:hypothetical protein ACHHYP_10068 [Achlya hypogyna]
MAGATSLHEIANGLLYSDVNLVRVSVHALSLTLVCSSRKLASLPHHAARARLESTVAHVERLVRDPAEAKRARNLIISLVSTVLTQSHDEKVGPKASLRTGERPHRLILVLRWLHRCDPAGVVLSIHRLLQVDDKKLLLRLYWILRDFVHALLVAGECSASDDKWTALLTTAVDHATKSTIPQGTVRAPTKLSVAAADAGLFVAHAVLISAPTDYPTEQTKHAAVSDRNGALRLQVCALLNEVLSWQAHKPQRALWVAGVAHLLQHELSLAFAVEFHHSALLLQSSFVPPASALERSLNHLASNKATRTAALRNLALVIGRRKTPLTLTEAQGLALAAQWHSHVDSPLFWAIARSVIQSEQWEPASRWSLISPLVAPCLDAPELPGWRPLYRLVREFEYPIASMIQTIRSATTPLAVLEAHLSFAALALQATPVPPVWLPAATTAVLDVYFHHPSQRARELSLPLLPRLDLRAVFAACGERVQHKAPSPLAELTLAFLFGRWNDALLPLLLNLVKNLGFLGTEAPTDVRASRDRLLSLLPPWLEHHVPAAAEDAVTDTVVLEFLADVNDATSLQVLRLVCKALPSAFPRVFKRMTRLACANTAALVCAETDAAMLPMLRPYLALRFATPEWWARCDTGALVELQELLVTGLCTDAVTPTVHRVLVDLVAKYPPQQTTPVVMALLSSSTLSDKSEGVLIYTLGYVVAQHLATLDAWGAPVLSFLMKVLSAPVQVDSAHQRNFVRGFLETPTAILHNAIVQTEGDLRWLDFVADAVLAGAWHRPHEAYPPCTALCRQSSISPTLRSHMSVVLLRSLERAALSPRVVERVVALLLQTFEDASSACDDVSLALEVTSATMLLCVNPRLQVLIQLVHVGAMNTACDPHTQLFKAVVRLLTIPDLSVKMTTEVLDALAMVLTKAPAAGKSPEFLKLMLAHFREICCTTADEAVASMASSLVDYIETMGSELLT